MKAFLLILVLLAGAYAQSNSVNINIDAIDFVEDNSTTCTICKDLVGAVESAITTNSSEAYLLLILAQSCDALGEGILVALCKSFVSSVGSDIIQYVISNQPADVICEEVDMCSANETMMATLDEQIEMLKLIVEEMVGDNSTTCTVCNTLVSAVEDAMADNTTQPFLLLVLAQTCDAIGAPPVVALCQLFVNKFGPDLINYVVSNQPASVVCSELDMCSSDDVIDDLEAQEFFHVPVVEEIQEESVADDSLSCQVCEALVGALETAIQTNTSYAYLEATLDQACAQLPSILNILCQGVVKEYAPQMIQWVLQGEDAQTVCDQLDLCNDSSTFVMDFDTIEKLEDDFECQICGILVNALEMVVETNTSETYLISVMQDACDIMPSNNWEAQCKSIINDVGKLIIQYVLQDENATVICQQVGLCNSSTTDEKMQGYETIEEPEDSELECMICGILVNVLEDVIKINQSEEYLLAQMEDACKKLPSNSWVAQCQTLVGQVGLQIIQYVLDDETSTVVCIQVGLCPNKSSSSTEEKMEAFRILIAEEEEPKKVEGDFECQLCGILVNALEQAVETNTSLEFLAGVLNDTCDVILIPSWKMDCQTIVSTSGPALIQWVLQQEDPKVICQQVGLCPNSSSVVEVVAARDPRDYSCQLCSVIGEALDTEANGSQTESYLFGVMLKSCTTLNGEKEQKDCQDLVFNYGTQMIRVYDQTQNGTEMCDTLNFCNSSEKLAVANVGDEIVCAACTWVVTRAEHWLESNKTETEILDLIEKDCDILIDKKWVDSCKATVAKFGGEIIQRIIADSPPPNVICTDIDLCSSNSTSPAVPAKPVNPFVL